LTAAWAAPLAGEPAAVHVLNRLAYGPRPGDIERVRQAGVQAYIEEQLNPPPLPLALAQRLDQLATLKMSAGESLARFQEARAMGQEMARNGQQGGGREAVAQMASEAAEARLLRAIESPRQLEEVMVDFWYNHFNVFAGKGQDRALVASYERDAIRPYVFGSFRQMLGATAHHPAMLFYLDNWVSKAGGLNENYARELMELHTLGVDGGYTQQDVTELARMLTGWTYAPRRDAQFVFDPRRHDNGPKTWTCWRCTPPPRATSAASWRSTSSPTSRRRPWWSAWRNPGSPAMAISAPCCAPCSPARNSWTSNMPAPSSRRLTSTWYRPRARRPCR
jgi:uncharacterized protein (DUF1800 family)